MVTAAHNSGLDGLILIDAWNIAFGTSKGAITRDAMIAGFDDFGNSLHGATPETIADEVVAKRSQWDLRALGAAPRKSADPHGHRQIWRSRREPADHRRASQGRQPPPDRDRDEQRSFLRRSPHRAVARRWSAGSTGCRRSALRPAPPANQQQDDRDRNRVGEPIDDVAVAMKRPGSPGRPRSPRRTATAPPAASAVSSRNRPMTRATRAWRRRHMLNLVVGMARQFGRMGQHRHHEGERRRRPEQAARPSAVPPVAERVHWVGARKS